MKTFADKAINFYRNIQLELPDGEVEVLNPFKNKQTFDLVKTFFQRYYADHQRRIFIFGINPGRFGAGLTGISFTDPVNLAEKCGIPNNLPQKHELSSQFIYQVIADYGEVSDFYKRFYVTAVSPLGFVRGGKNLNYYDDPKLMLDVERFIAASIEAQLDFGVHRDAAICIGGDKNFRYLSALNERLKLFGRLIPLEHPRFIMQYRRKSLNLYLKKYLNALKSCEDDVMD